MGLGEFGRIDRFYKPLAAGFPGALGLENDAAVFSVPPGRELVVTSDAMVAGVHFLATDPPQDIAAKLLRVNLSDLAAMGADPLAYSLMTALPRDIGDDWVEAFTAGLATDQQRYGFPLSGGDSVTTPGPLTLAITAMGTVPQGTALPRRAVLPPEDALLYVSGTPGDAALGLAHVLGKRPIIDETARSALVARLRRPEPRLSVGRGLRCLALACLDISDGLMGDLAHMARASGGAALIETGKLPLSAAAHSVLTAHPDAITDILSGGDDYELLFAVAADRTEEVRALSTATGVALTAIGRLGADNVRSGQVVALDALGRPLHLDKLGWTHQ